MFHRFKTIVNVETEPTVDSSMKSVSDIVKRHYLFVKLMYFVTSTRRSPFSVITDNYVTAFYCVCHKLMAASCS